MLSCSEILWTTRKSLRFRRLAFHRASLTAPALLPLEFVLLMDRVK
uniref:Uncharacterized protein n=1 Tax=Arundo donax TaxID=35708 RepID=A0A0A9B8M1_ARUDO